ncbi:hypothetical protein OKW38_006538 [Paraburkholderia sp. MM5496-R1]
MHLACDHSAHWASRAGYRAMRQRGHVLVNVVQRSSRRWPVAGALTPDAGLAGLVVTRRGKEQTVCQRGQPGTALARKREVTVRWRVPKVRARTERAQKCGHCHARRGWPACKTGWCGAGFTRAAPRCPECGSSGRVKPGCRSRGSHVARAWHSHEIHPNAAQRPCHEPSSPAAMFTHRPSTATLK